MKHWERWLVYPLLGISLLFSIAVLCKWCPRMVEPENLGFDYIGVIIGILSLLVTVLLGWQIFNAISFDNRMNNLKKKYKTKLDESFSYMDASTEFIQGIIVLSNISTKRYSVAYDCFALSLFHYLKAGVDIMNKADNCISNMESSFKKMTTDDMNYDYTNIEETISNILLYRKNLNTNLISRLKKLESDRKKFVQTGEKQDFNNNHNTNIKLQSNI